MTREKEKIVASIEIECFAHATESKEKVLEALLNLAPQELRTLLKEKISHFTLRGYHGNPIVLYKLKLEKEFAQQMIKYIFSKMEDFDLKLMSSSLKERSDKASFYFRLDKQHAYLGIFRVLQGDDVIKIKVSFLPHIRGIEKIKDALSALGLKIE